MEKRAEPNTRHSIADSALLKQFESYLQITAGTMYFNISVVHGTEKLVTKRRMIL